MLSETISLSNLRRYERECRRQAMTETNAAIRTELFKFADAFQQAARELELHCNGLEHRREPADEIIPYDSLLESTGTA